MYVNDVVVLATRVLDKAVEGEHRKRLVFDVPRRLENRYESLEQADPSGSSDSCIW